MKKLIIALSITFFSTNLLISSPLGDGNKKCRFDVTNSEAALNSEEELTQDLLSGVWMKETTCSSEDKSITSLQFTAMGLVGILTKSKEDITDYSNRIWRLNTSKTGQTILVLTNLNAAKERSYQVERHCDGLTLTTIETGDVIHLTYAAHQQAKQLKVTRNTLSGTWKSMIFPENGKVKSAAYEYQLKKDGSIEKIFSGDNIKAIIQKGFWQISPDAQYLILHFQEEEQFQTTIAKINYLAFDELVLGQSAATSDVEKAVCGDLASFYFNKQ